MKQLFLCSYFAGVKNLFKQYASKKQLGKHVLFIPTAGNVEEYRGYIDEALQTFEDLGFQVEVLDISACDRETAQAKIFQSKLLYISGGNTFYLLQELKKKQLLSLIKEQIADGMVYVGESAGAIITAKDIDYNKIMDDKEVAGELSDTVALHEADFYLLPHVGEEPFAESAQSTLDTYSDQLHLLPLNNHQAVLVEVEEVKVLVENK
ncbi:Type 1 glutamine amidotransferase-like domain-containing protein [Streptococcus sanguinis]|uniref:Type 1 glutamine amidotransferase-like domain-containing protein n=1 Tax=Streptococcus sanguinis TaxID=1305 RepID=UPI002283452D|nr:Type 1 glutamine amidotransferase-like domain-containing protein [Streptococcus sanguinis]MCY7040479.1 Type 1 glutamine amidotransferase-like domain-containing protein [Streptococcus sanguinis]